MSANFELSSSGVNSLRTLLPDAIYRSRDKAIQEISNLNSADKATFFKRIALIIRAECFETLQENKNEFKKKKKSKKGCFNIFRRKSKNFSVKNKSRVGKLLNHEFNVFDILTVLCLKDLSDLPTTTNIETFADESIKLILNKCNDELPKILKNDLNENLNDNEGNTSCSPIIWLKRDSSRDRYLGKIEPDYLISQQIHLDKEQHLESDLAFIFDKNYNWRSIYSAQQLSRIDSEKHTKIDEVEQYKNNESEDTATTYIHKSEDEKNKLKQRLEKIINKNVIPLEEAYVKMNSLCQFIKATDYGLNNQTNTSSECEEQEETNDDTASINSSDGSVTQNVDQQITDYVSKMSKSSSDSVNNENTNQKTTEQIISGKNFTMHTLKSIEVNKNLHENFLIGYKSSDIVLHNEIDESHSVETNSKNAKFQFLQSDDIPQNEAKISQVKLNLDATETTNTSTKTCKIQQKEHYKDNNTPRYHVKNKILPEKHKEKKKNYNLTLEKGKALQIEKQQKALQSLKQKEKREQERRSKQLAEYEQKLLKQQQAAKLKKFEVNHTQYQEQLNHNERNGFPK